MTVITVTYIDNFGVVLGSGNASQTRQGRKQIYTTLNCQECDPEEPPPDSLGAPAEYE